MDKDGQGFLFSVVFLERVLTKHFKNLFTLFLANINVVTQSYFLDVGEEYSLGAK